MVRKYLPYSLLVLKVNLLVSILVAVMVAYLFSSGVTFNIIIYVFMLSFLTGGYLLGVLYFEFTRYREYYFYYNLGISKLRLIIFTYLFHLILSIPLLVFLNYARHT